MVEPCSDRMLREDRVDQGRGTAWLTYVGARRLWVRETRRCSQAACVRACALVASPCRSRALGVNVVSEIAQVGSLSSGQQKRPSRERRIPRTGRFWRKKARRILRAGVSPSLLPPPPAAMCLGGTCGQRAGGKRLSGG